jgi:fatty-acyl-CoA synthase
VTVVQGWGMTEMSPIGTVSTLRPEQLELPAEAQVQLRAGPVTASSAFR